MLKEFVEKIVLLAEAKTQFIEGRTYSDKYIFPVEAPTAKPLAINTLTGIVDYLAKEVDLARDHSCAIHIGSHTNVSVISPLNKDSFMGRNYYLVAEHKSPVFRFGEWYGVEAFIIALQSQFIQDLETAMILKVAGNVKEEGVTQFTDDGVTQAVTAKSGIARVEQVAVPNPVTLRAFRTFREVTQPASTFIFRMRGEKGFPPSCALFEADGKMWQLEAIDNIKVWLMNALPDVPVIG